MTEIKPPDIKLGLEEKEMKEEDLVITYDACYKKEDINQRISELLNTLEEPIDFSAPSTLKLSEIVTTGMNNEHDNTIYKIGFRDGEEAQRKKTKEVFLK